MFSAFPGISQKLMDYTVSLQRLIEFCWTFPQLLQTFSKYRLTFSENWFSIIQTIHRHIESSSVYHFGLWLGCWCRRRFALAPVAIDVMYSIGECENQRFPVDQNLKHKPYVTFVNIKTKKPYSERTLWPRGDGGTYDLKISILVFQFADKIINI